MATAESPPPELSSTGRAPKPWDKLKRRSRGSTQSASTPTVTRNAKNTNALRELNVSLAGGENGEGGGGGSGGVGAIAGGVNGAARGADVKTADRMTSREGEAGAGARASATSSGKTATSSGAKVQSAVRVNVNLKKPSTISSPAPGGSRDGGGMTAKVSSPSPPPPQTTSATTRRGAVKKMVIAQPADDKKKKQQQNEKEVVASGGGVSPGPAFDWLLQRQLEVEMSLRGSLLNSQEDLIGTRRTFAAFAAFFRELHDAAKTLGCASAVLFQELLHRVAGVNAGVSMDEQKRDGDVPMHQAKVRVPAGESMKKTEMCVCGGGKGGL